MAAGEALVIAAHGSLDDERAAIPAHAHAARLRARNIFEEIHVAFWKEEPGLRTVVRHLEVGAVTVVPLLASAGYFAGEVFPTELGIGEDDQNRTTLRYTEPVGTHPAVADVIAVRAASAMDEPSSTTVILVGHGTGRNRQSAASTRRHAERLRRDRSYAAVKTAFLDEEPNVANVLESVSTKEVIVVPLFVADGPHTAEDVPTALAHPGIGRTANIDGHAVHYTGAIGTAPAIADVIEERAREAGAGIHDVGESSGSIGLTQRLTARFEAGEAPMDWGEVRVRHEPDGYALSHVVDATRDRSELSVVKGLGALRRHVRRDDCDRYRSLTGERTLPRGWIVSALNPRELVRSLEVIYPGAVSAWDRDEHGAINPTPLEETVGRQRGMYAEIGTLDSESRRAAVESVCGNCVRDPRWACSGLTYAERERSIPCEEACPFFLAAAHGLADQSTAAANAVDADDHPAAFDDPANRFRVRYARSLTSDKDTSLVPGGED